MTEKSIRGNIEGLLKSQRLRLRAVEPADIGFLYDLENDPVVWRAGNTITPFSRYQIEQYVYSTDHDIYTEKQIRLMIETFDNEEKRCIGAIDLFNFDPHHRRSGIGILVIPGEREKGYAAESIELVKNYVREILHLHQLYCSVISNNSASIRLFEKAGFKSFGMRKDWRFQNNEWEDELLYQFIFD